MEGMPKYGSPEKKESQELFRASIGFDFIFVQDELGRKVPFCIELNGHDTGVFGYTELEDADTTKRIVAGIRTEFDQEYAQAFRENRRMERGLASDDVQEGRESIDLLLENEKRQKILEEKKLIRHAFHNPREIEEIANNKKKQEAFIPEKYRPRYWHQEGDVSRTGYWILKPKMNRGGRGIIVVPESDLSHTLETAQEKLGFLNVHDLFVIQEFYFVADADNAGDTYEGHPAALRLLIDFQYLEDGSIRKIQQVGYQRVSQERAQQSVDGLNKTHIVNKLRGAVAVEASPEEIEAASLVALQIIQNIGKSYQGEKKEL